MNTSSRGICTMSLLVFLLFSSVAPSVALLRSPASIFSASELIGSLNLFPGRSVNIVDDEFVDRDAPKLVEKRINFPNLFDSMDGATTDELGHHAGYYRIEHSHNARMFYFFFESRNSQEDPVVIWLTGGPGCSSELALFYENGPFRIADNLSLVWNENGWDKVSNILFVDQPIGTGFSYTTDRRDIPHDEKGVSDDLYDFLQAFFKEHPHLAQNDFYITGESYAGHYIPAFAARVHQGNQANEGIHVNLKGFAMGNGLTDPAIQYGAYSDFALNMGLINQSEHDHINNALPLCESAINLCGTDGTIACMAAYVFCNRIFTSILAQAGNINYYDIRRECEGSLCYDFSNLESYLNQESVREAIGVGDIDFVSCSPIVYRAMLMDWMRNLEVGIPALLEDGVKMLIYAGEYDLICNWLGNSRWVHAMEWSGQREFQAATEVPFQVDGSEAGLLTSYGPLSFLKVHNAGHMVPMDQPKASLDMLSRWMNGSLSQPLAETDDLLVSSI